MYLCLHGYVYASIQVCVCVVCSVSSCQTRARGGATGSNRAACRDTPPCEVKSAFIPSPQTRGDGRGRLRGMGCSSQSHGCLSHGWSIHPTEPVSSVQFGNQLCRKCEGFPRGTRLVFSASGCSQQCACSWKTLQFTLVLRVTQGSCTIYLRWWRFYRSHFKMKYIRGLIRGLLKFIHGVAGHTWLIDCKSIIYLCQ